MIVVVFICLSLDHLEPFRKKMKQSLHRIERIKQHVYSAIEQNYHILKLIGYQTEDITQILGTFNNFSRRIKQVEKQ